MDLFPYSPRPNQRKIVELVSGTVKNQRHLILESGTGTGKTVCVLVGCLQEALKDGRKVVYLTRTNSQQRQVIEELRSISAKHTVFGIGIQGRQSTCPLIRRDPDLKGGNPEELSKLCGEKKRRTVAGQDGGCRFYQETISTGFDEIEAHCRKELPTVEEFVKYCDGRGVCPYELTKELAHLADVVTAPYAYFFVPFIRNSLLDWLAVPLEGAVVVVDEAHNLPEYARETKTFDLSSRLLGLVEKEVDEYGDPEVMNGASILDVTAHIRKSLDNAVAEYLIDDDGLIPPAFLEESLMQSFTATSRSITLAAKALMTHGEIIREKKKEMGRLPRSYIFTMGSFLDF
ncbi:MAG: DEAD/DEAH box helicase, partial [Methanomassiliicoccales archaeon]|nr:DEAD/DEAH box helicase [Methanomassiliicoccales archaeon]